MSNKIHFNVIPSIKTRSNRSLRSNQPFGSWVGGSHSMFSLHRTRVYRLIRHTKRTIGIQGIITNNIRAPNSKVYKHIQSSASHTLYTHPESGK